MYHAQAITVKASPVSNHATPAIRAKVQVGQRCGITREKGVCNNDRIIIVCKLEVKHG